jgi:hypothetical protein
MIPVPPFADPADARLFIQQLSLHLAALDRDRVTLPTFLLLTTLDAIHGSLHRVRNDRSPVRLPALVLRIALLSRFPAPWTPQGIHAALDAGDDWATASPSRATSFSTGYDPVIRAELAGGTWTVTHHERGSTRVLHAGLTDAEYVRVLMDDERGHPFPYGWTSDHVPGFAEVVREAGRVRDGWDAGFGRLPYLTNWIAQRDAAL